MLTRKKPDLLKGACEMISLCHCKTISLCSTLAHFMWGIHQLATEPYRKPIGIAPKVSPFGFIRGKEKKSNFFLSLPLLNAKGEQSTLDRYRPNSILSWNACICGKLTNAQKKVMLSCLSWLTIARRTCSTPCSRVLTDTIGCPGERESIQTLEGCPHSRTRMCVVVKNLNIRVALQFRTLHICMGRNKRGLLSPLKNTSPSSSSSHSSSKNRINSYFFYS